MDERRPGLWMTVRCSADPGHTRVMPNRHRWEPVCQPPTCLTRPLPVDPDGRTGPTRSQAGRPGGPAAFRRTSPGLFVPSSVTDEVPEQRILECSMLLPAAPVVGAVTGWASLRVLQGGFFDGLAPDGTTRLPVPLAVGPNRRRRPRPGVLWLQELLDPAEIWLRHGIPHTMPERAVFDEMRRQTDVREAVVAVDMAVAGEITSIDRMRRYVALRAGSRGVAMVRAALDLADEAAGPRRRRGSG